jgi:dTMP kinase
MAIKKRGFFITLEGPDGAGKSTQFKLLAEKIRQAGFLVKETREPGGHPLAEKIREMLLNDTDFPLASETELFLFLAARSQHVKDVIRPALNQSQVVLCERFSDSTYAYQVGGRKLAATFVRSANKFATHGLKPDLTLLYALPVKTGLQRAFQAKQQHDRIESESGPFLKNVWRAYATLARQEPKRIRVISAHDSLEKVTQNSWVEIQKHLPRMKRQCHGL